MNEAARATEDTLLGGRVRFRQPVAGYRAGMDAVFLAAACDAGAGERVLDVGCGAGAVLLSAAARLSETRFVGLERDPVARALASENIGLNGWAERAEAVSGDVAQLFSRLGLPPFDAALCNPPYFDDPATLRGPAPEKTGAWLADAGLEGWIVFLSKAVREGGAVTVIHRADRLADILRLFAPKLGSIQVRPIHPFADAAAKRVLVRGIKTGKAPLRLLPPLVLHERDGGRPTAAASAVMTGATLSWF